MSPQSAPRAVQLTDYVLVVRRQWAVIVAGVLLAAVLAAGYLAVAPREYTAATSVLVTASGSGSSAAGRAAAINLDTEARLVTATETVSAAAELLGITGEEALELGGRVTVTVPPNTDILTISFVAPTAEGAQAGAEAFAEAYLQGRFNSEATALDAEYFALQDRIDEIRAQLDEVTAQGAQLPAASAERARIDAQASSLNNQLASLGSQQNEVRSAATLPGRVVTQAVLPSSPSSPDVPLTVLAGMVVGLLVGIAVAALRHHLDDRIRTVRDLERRTEVPPAAVLLTPLDDGEIAVVPPSGPDGRAVGRLRNLVTSNLARAPRKVLLVAGTHRGAGNVAASIAASLARAGEEVTLVCADAFGNTAASLLRTTPAHGLGEALAAGEDADDLARPVPDVPRLRVLGPGRDADRADALLQGGRGVRTVLDRLLESASYVVVEAPATTDGVGAQTLAAAAELALLVVEADRTTARDVRDALGQFESMQRPLLGAVLVTVSAEPAGGEHPRPMVPVEEQPADRRPAEAPVVPGPNRSGKPSEGARTSPPPGGRDVVRR